MVGRETCGRVGGTVRSSALRQAQHGQAQASETVPQRRHWLNLYLFRAGNRGNWKLIATRFRLLVVFVSCAVDRVCENARDQSDGAN